MPRLLTENIEPVCWYQTDPTSLGLRQRISNLLLRHADTNFATSLGAEWLLVDIRTVNHSFRVRAACGQHERKNRRGGDQRFTARSDLFLFGPESGTWLICNMPIIIDLCPVGNLRLQVFLKRLLFTMTLRKSKVYAASSALSRLPACYG